jgi:hypothetical protein
MPLDYTASDTVEEAMQEVLNDPCLRQRLTLIIRPEQIQPVCDLIRNFCENQRVVHTDRNTLQVSQNSVAQNEDRTSLDMLSHSGIIGQYPSVATHQVSSPYPSILMSNPYALVPQLDQSLSRARFAQAPSDSGIVTHVSSSTEPVLFNQEHRMYQPDNMGLHTYHGATPSGPSLDFALHEPMESYGTWPTQRPESEQYPPEPFIPWESDQNTHGSENLDDTA